ncbi:MAG: hypothetical protein Q6J68_02105 [Thermostichales cyanobacterium SZTDM-1c_bins_54]
MTIQVIPQSSIKAFRYRVHCLEHQLWSEVDPVCRANLALQLADAATTLARMEVQAAQQRRLAQAGLQED